MTARLSKTLQTTLLGAAAALLPLAGWPATAAASGGMVGQCADCHTMHNSEQGQPVAKTGLAGDITATPVRNLLRYDCIACHAQGALTKTVTLTGGSVVPQVYHGDGSDLAAGNFKHITDGTGRKGHNVSDLFNGGDDNGGMYEAPPGKYYASVHGQYFSDGGTPFNKFTCAGAVGCHGTRANLLSGETITVTNADGSTTDTFVGERRIGIAAISGAHHNSRDGLKNPTQVTGGHDGQHIAASYRFIDGLWGGGNLTARWQNVDSSSHNEYLGRVANAYPDSCNSCHVEGSQPGISPRMTFDSTLKVPNQSMSGFCATCHGNFHSSGLETGTSQDLGPYNGTSGAFLRHPSDYVIPAAGEYADYTTYALSAPVARPASFFVAGMLPSAQVTPGTDMVMCLSCHMAHASPHDGMLRFDYQALTSGMRAGDGNQTHAGKGCLACHTAKGGPLLVP